MMTPSQPKVPWLRWAARLTLTAALLTGLVWVSHTPFGTRPAQGVLRLAGRMVAGKVSVCRDSTPQELASLPPHQRKKKVCKSRLFSYTLRVAVDGALLADDRLDPPGLSHDRPIYVQKEFALAAGEHRLALELEPDGEDETGVAISGPRPPGYRLYRKITLHPGRVMLVWLDEKQGEFHVMGEESADTP